LNSPRSLYQRLRGVVPSQGILAFVRSPLLRRVGPRVCVASGYKT